MKLSHLWDWNGAIGRRAYILWGTILFALKWNLDRLVFEGPPGSRAMGIADYFQAGFPASEWMTRDTVRNFNWLLLLALPFLWSGVVLTVQRLRSARLPLWLAALFVVPVLKWFLFLVAALAPRRDEPEPPLLEGARESTWLERICPHSRIGSALASVGISCVLLWAATLLGTHGLQQYGWGLFFGLPFIIGFLAAMLHGMHLRRSLPESLLVAVLAVMAGAAGFVLMAIEGIICIAMAAPLALPMSLMGALLGHLLQPARHRKPSPHLLCAAVLALPLMLGDERLEDAAAPLLAVRTSVDVAAPPARVWRHVVEFSELPPPSEWIFRLGIAYPQRAQMFGSGPGAVRHCVFSTGPFVEPIEIWDEPHLLRFSVTKNPPPMEEWTPYKAIHPPHLDGFLASERGQFQLIPLPDGGTRLEGTTWYRHNMWPVMYWQTWSDLIIHRIHLRVLQHIKERAEKRD
jgi:uncharacterized membrane protein YhaH (DUF805 family)